jgi:hypothetical protein
MAHHPLGDTWQHRGVAANYASAAASHVIVGDGIDAIIGPVVLLALTAASLALRPAASTDNQFRQVGAPLDGQAKAPRPRGRVTGHRKADG